MNASDFFTREQFDSLKRDITEKKCFGIFDTPYQKKLKVKGNAYSLAITTGHYIVGDHAYFVHFSEDHHYPGNIGGCGGSTPNTESYESFCDYINGYLKKFPDYTEAVFNPIQLCLW
jgi:hypothetical protein